MFDAWQISSSRWAASAARGIARAMDSALDLPIPSMVWSAPAEAFRARVAVPKASVRRRVRTGPRPGVRVS